MEKEISSIELKYIVDELQFLKNARIDTIYQNDRNLRLKFHLMKKESLPKEFELFISPERVHLTELEKITEASSQFCMFLRKYLRGKTVKSIQQYKLGKIIKISADDFVLICELFNHGNYILCDSNYKILMPLEFRQKDREILPRKKYMFPKVADIDDITSFKQLFLSSNLNAISFLGNIIGPLYAKEACIRAKINEKKVLEENDIENLFDIIKGFISEDSNPHIVLENKKPIDVVPFRLMLYKEFDKKYFDSFNAALNEFFRKEEGEKIKKTETEKKIAKESQQKISTKQKGYENIAPVKTDKKIESDLIYKNYGLVESILTTLNNAKLKYDWNTIKEIIQREDSIEANAIKEIKEDEGLVTIELNGHEIELEIDKSVEENANRYKELTFSKRKKLPATTEKTAGQEEPKKKEVKKPRKRWYEHFCNFMTSDNFLVVIASDDKTKKKILKKHISQRDIVLHADIDDAPVAVIKAEIDKRKKKSKFTEITPVAIKEAGEIVACYSKAWKLGTDSMNTYWVRANQIGKIQESDKSVSKDLFEILGEKNYLKKMSLKLAVGINRDGIILIGPLQTISTHCKYFITIKPGNVNSFELAKQIKTRLLQKSLPEDKAIIEKVPLEEIQKRIPYGRGEIVG
ncbi:MAG: DUF814 domain-containing protein [Candidatus Aenigmarchaeota archaeon]|nr:DUF814 domain-containing protein [Candidatus Aenigmarchaeota archaeon]